MEQVVIKLLDNPDNPKLKMKYVGSFEYAVPKLGKDGKLKTGFDENSIEVLSIEDSAKREKTKKAILKEREELQHLLNIDLDTNSAFWDKFFVVLSDEDIVLDPSNPMDRVKEKFLVANGYVAPSIEAIQEDEKYMNCIFYLHREAEETSKRVEKELKVDTAISKLVSLNENPYKLKLVAAYIFGTSEDELTTDMAYDKLREFIKEPIKRKQTLNVERFLDAIEKSPEEISVKLTLDKAIRKRIITSRNGIYRRGEQIIGNSYEEAVENLGSVEMNGELRSLIKEVEKL